MLVRSATHIESVDIWCWQIHSHFTNRDQRRLSGPWGSGKDYTLLLYTYKCTKFG